MSAGSERRQREELERCMRKWMIANADEYDVATRLVEGAVCEYPEVMDWMDEDAHWIWALAADQYCDW